MLPPPSDPPYREVPPPPELATLVASLWEMRFPLLADTRVRILPNACVDIVVYVGDASRGEGIAAIVAPPYRSFVVGSTLRSFMVRSAGARHVVGASLLPAGTLPLLGAPSRAIGETMALLHDLVGARAGEFEERILTGPPGGALQRMAAALSSLRRDAPETPVLDRAVNAVRAAGGVKRMDTLAAETNISPRQLERHFLQHTGMSAKTFARLVRFDRAVRDIGSRRARSWAQFALDHGYSDQAHFINEFKEFAGIPPAEFERESTGTPPATGS